MLKRIIHAISQLFADRRSAHVQVSGAAAIDPRTRYAIRAALSEVGITSPVSRRPRPLLYRELNRHGDRIWRAA